jgi:hypothetical protein
MIEPIRVIVPSGTASAAAAFSRRATGCASAIEFMAGSVDGRRPGAQRRRVTT